MLNPSGSLTSPEVAAFTPYPPDPSQNYATGGGFSNHFVYLPLPTPLNPSTNSSPEPLPTKKKPSRVTSTKHRPPILPTTTAARRASAQTAAASTASAAPFPTSPH